MSKLFDLPNELLIEILESFSATLPDNTRSAFLTLRLISRRLRQIIEETPHLWLKKEELEKISNEKTNNKKCQILKEIGIKNPSRAILILHFPRFRSLFLEAATPQYTDSLENGLAYVTDMASQHLSLAFFVLKDPEFRQAFLAHKDGIDYITTLAKSHKLIALFIITEDTNLLDKVLSGAGRGFFPHMKEIVSQYAEVFIAFFQDEKLQTNFLGRFSPPEDVILNAEICTVGYKFKIFDNDKDERDWFEKRSPKKLIDYIIQKLTDKRQSAIETQTNEADISMPRP